MTIIRSLFPQRALLIFTSIAMCACASLPDANGIGRGDRSSDRGGSAHIVVDFHSKKILSGQNAGARRQVASLTKIATSMVVLDWAAATGTDLSTVATVPASAAAIGGPNQMGLRPGDGMTLRDALYCAVIGSDNWAAETVANHVGADLMRRSRFGRGSPVGEFVKQMNSLAKKHGAENTKFTNPHGMDHGSPVPYSCAADIARLSIYAMGKPSFTFFCSQKEREVKVLSAAGERKFVVKNTNKLLGTEGIDGLKTGMTTKAGGCLAISAGKESLFTELPDGRTKVTPRRLVVVVLGSPDRFGVSRSLVARGWDQFAAWDAAGRVVRDPKELLRMPKD